MILRRVIVGPFESNCYIVGSESTREGMIIDPGAEPAQTQDLDQGDDPRGNAGGAGGEKDMFRRGAGLSAHDHRQQGDLAIDQHDMLDPHDQREP